MSWRTMRSTATALTRSAHSCGLSDPLWPRNPTARRACLGNDATHACVCMHAVARMTDRPMRLECARTLWCDGCAPEGTARHGCVLLWCGHHCGAQLRQQNTNMDQGRARGYPPVGTGNATLNSRSMLHRSAASCNTVQQVAAQCSKLQHSAACWIRQYGPRTALRIATLHASVTALSPRTAVFIRV